MQSGIFYFAIHIQWTLSNPATLAISQSVLIRGVASFQGWIYTTKHTLGPFSMQGWPHFKGPD